MTTNFDSVQMLKTSDVCNKYSKSVSYETLVGGTTTTGTERKQTRRLFLSSADKPLTAVGTLTSLLCNSAKVMEKLLRHVITRRTLVRRCYLPEQGTHVNKESLFASVTWLMRLPRRIQRMLLRMTIPALALLFTFATTSESWADDVIPTSGTCNDAGTCLWSLDSDGTLTISAKDGAEDVKMANYYCYTNPCDQSSLISRPWEESLQQIKSVVIGDNITHIGNDAFQNASNLTSVTGMKDVKTIGETGVFANTGLTSITIPDSVTSIGNLAFDGARSLKIITIPDNIDTANWSDSAFAYLPNNTKIVCQGDLNTCYEKLAKYIPKDKGGKCTGYCISSVSEATKEQCGGEYTWDENSTPKCRHMTDTECANSAQYYINNGQCKSMPGSETTCKNADLLWDGSSCVKSCASGFVERDKECLPGSETTCKNADLLWDGSSCVKSCASGFVEWDKECLSEYPFAKKRWTPAEANEWLHDGNDNFVVITFKK